MPIEKWCRERGISKQTYYRWQKRVFEAAQRQQQVEFAEVMNIPPQTGQQNGGNRSRVTVEMSPGVRLQVQAVE